MHREECDTTPESGTLNHDLLATSNLRSIPAPQHAATFEMLQARDRGGYRMRPWRLSLSESW